MAWITQGGTGKPSCVPRYWENNPAVSTIRDDYIADCMAIAERYAARPELEVVGCQGEKSLGSPGKAEVVPAGGTAFDDAARQLIDFDIATQMQAAYPQIWAMVAVNNNSQSPFTAFIDFFEATPGVGYRCPDIFTGTTSRDEVPVTDWEKTQSGLGWYGKTMAHCDNQNPSSSRFNGQACDPVTDRNPDLADHIVGVFGGSAYQPAKFNPSATYPAGGTGSGHASTHPTLTPNDNNPLSCWLAELDAVNWGQGVPNFMGTCPSIITDAGRTCDTTPP